MAATEGPDDLTIAVQRYGISHTVPLLREASGRTHPCGSGVVIFLCERWFVLTAGHVLAGLRGATFVIGAPLVEEVDPLTPQTQSTMALTFPRDGVLAVDVAFDAGVVEVAPRTPGATAELARAAVPLDAIVAVTTVEPKAWRECNVTVTGYPGALSESLTDDAIHGAFAYTTGVAGDPPLRPVPLFLREQVPPELMALWTDHAGVRSSFFDPGAPGELPDLAGASGGGYWAILLKDEVAAIYLVATHTKSRVVGDERFLWGTPVGFHLKIIAELAPELAPEILRRWPKLRDYVVRPARY